ncbi:MAG: hypothetical protein F6K40_32185 [Okeania sp. SIO3I5]|uniref:hypothetical protein n=1 Tax=Okeania sp. SIO3I5 TaxID=2607805 RepID=UPI0013BAEA4A|nr:hypothetical protein [Okeania sp. SIO3I5]NEQ40635.1 hypothetical protein [Okeania sp. SIO3I5]
MTIIIQKLHVIIVAIFVSFLANCAGKVESKTPTNTILSNISKPLAEVKISWQINVYFDDAYPQQFSISGKALNID